MCIAITLLKAVKRTDNSLKGLSQTEDIACW